MSLCGIIMPRQEDAVGHHLSIVRSGYLAECILSDVHGHGPHVFRTPEGKLFAWENDKDCDCDSCVNSEDSNDQCIVFWEIDESEVALYQKGGRR